MSNGIAHVIAAGPAINFCRTSYHRIGSSGDYVTAATVGTGQRRRAANSRHRFQQNVLPLAVEFAREKC
jgi:hypothetical protein